MVPFLPASLLLFRSSPEEVTGAPEAAFLALRDAPLGPALPANKWLAGVEGREVSGVGIGVDSVEVVAPSGFLDPPTVRESPGIGGGSSSPFSELEGGVRSSTLSWGATRAVLFSDDPSNSLTCWSK